MNVVIVIADALRHDALRPDRDSPLGGETSMPRLAHRFEDWTMFDHCFSSAPWTLPAVTSLLTGQASARHDHFAHDHRLTFPTLPDGLGSDYVTAAVVNNSALDRSSGLFGGFDEYSLHRHHGETFDAAHRFLDDRARDQRPYFLLLHSNLTHDYNEWSTREHYEWSYPDRDDWFELGRRILSWQGLNAGMRALIPDMYRACAQALDEQVDRFLDRLDPNETALAFVSDHGEGLDFDGGRIHHGGRVHNDLIRVPCAITLPSNCSVPARALADAARGAIGSIDILPTLFAAAGRPTIGDIDGQAVDGGASGTGRPISSDDRRYVYLASRTRLNTNERGKNMSRAARWKNQAFRSTVGRQFGLRSIIDYPYKLVTTEFDASSALLQRVASPALSARHVGAPVAVVRGERWLGLELFDLDADPLETRNLLLERADAVSEAAEIGAGGRTVGLADLIGLATTRQ